MITVVMIVKNGERSLAKVLESLKSFDEVILADTGSTDHTLSVAKDFSNVSLQQIPFEGFGKTRNRAACFAKNDWILSIDSDEIVTIELVEEIKNLSLDPECVYSLNFQNFFNDRRVKWCGWFPESHVRLYHKGKTAFNTSMVHEGVITIGLKIKKLRFFIHHTPYNSISDFLVKMERYSTLFAEQNRGQKRSSPFIAFYHGLGAFFKSFILKKGILGGYEGFLISCYNGHTAFYKYLKLYHLNANRDALP